MHIDKYNIISKVYEKVDLITLRYRDRCDTWRGEGERGRGGVREGEGGMGPGS